MHGGVDCGNDRERREDVLGVVSGLYLWPARVVWSTGMRKTTIACDLF